MNALNDRLGWSLPSPLAAAVPFICATIGAIIGNMPVSLVGGVLPSPLFALMPIYFWSLVRPDLMPPWAVLTIGVVQDLLGGGAPGVWTVAFVATYALIDRERDSFAGLAGFGAVLGFAGAMLTAGLVAYLIVAFYYFRFPPLSPIVIEIVVSVVFYIPAAYILNFIHQKLVGPLRSDF
jgi:rod shape-determining protein MreD